GLTGVNSGCRPGQVVTVGVALSRRDYPQPPQVRAFYQALLERVAALPGVESVGATTGVLLSALPNSSYVAIEGQPQPTPAQRVEVTIDTVTPGLFRTVGTPLLAGRDLAAADGPDA